MMGQQGVLRTVEGGNLMFWCPGCESHHAVNIRESNKPQWGWNGDVDKPTFSPSILLQWGHHVRSYGRGPGQMCQFGCDDPENGGPTCCGVCHSFVTAGNIQFLSDCTHKLAGQTVPLTAGPSNGG